MRLIGRTDLAIVLRVSAAQLAALEAQPGFPGATRHAASGELAYDMDAISAWSDRVHRLVAEEQTARLMRRLDRGARDQ
jgi:hypothetical protein